MTKTNKTKQICCLCGQPAPASGRWGEGPTAWGHNPWPLTRLGRCCSICNDTVVIPARLSLLAYRAKAQAGGKDLT